MNKSYIDGGLLYTFDAEMNLFVTDAPSHASGNRADRIIVRRGSIVGVVLLAALAMGWI